MKHKILLTGATGTIGSALSQRMAEHDDVALRMFVRSPKKVTSLSAKGVELVQGTFEDPESLRAAVKGIDTVVLITPFGPSSVDQAHAVIVAAKEAGVQRIVRLSAILADATAPYDSYRLHGQTDAEIQDSDLIYTIIRPSAFMHLLLGYMSDIRNERSFRIALGDGRFGMIDTRDIVDVFEKVLFSNEYDGQILTLTGPDSISLHDAARIISQELGFEISYVPVYPDKAEEFYRSLGVDGWYLSAFCDYSVAFHQNYQDCTTDDVERVTGHPARSLEVFVREVFAPVFQQ